MLNVWDAANARWYAPEELATEKLPYSLTNTFIAIMDRFDIFVLPFTFGFAFIVIFYISQLAIWINKFPKPEKAKLRKLLISPVRLFKCAIEIVKESLLHVNLYKTNLRLGFMHMSLAFGWFMLIVLGNLESKMYTDTHINPPYFPIFLKFFIPDMGRYQYHQEFSFVMDFFLLLVLTGVALAIVKRFVPKQYSIIKKPKLTVLDKVGLTSLWLIFPLRFIAESLSAGLNNSGGFATQPVGDYLVSIGLGIPSSYSAWWAYSAALGVFFVVMPFTRYMHILTEPFFIFLRHAKVNPDACEDVFNKVQVRACSKCGVCVSVCPLTRSSIESNPQPIYMLDALRTNSLTPAMMESCLSCRKCEESCPVGITIDSLRTSLKEDIVKGDFAYTDLAEYPKTKIGYFAGCMGKLTPHTSQSLIRIANIAGDNMVQLDSGASICCGRPQLLSGQTEIAQDIIARNKALIQNSEVELLVTSCPICLKTFKDNYNLDIRILHHSQYICKLIEDGKVSVRKAPITTTYHDPCELSRGLSIKDEPRLVLKEISNFAEIAKVHRSQCCGNSLNHNNLSSSDKQRIAKNTLANLPQNAEYLITSCPACSKAFKGISNIIVEDIAVFTERHLEMAKNVQEEILKSAITAKHR